jgi:DNA-directed RNA polymerase specialized sigma24 family protein
MTSPGEAFVLQLARASRKANFLVRRLPRADREDVIAEALAWCWQNRDNYSLTTTLDTWFVSAVRHALTAWRRGEMREAAKAITDIPTGDTTAAEAETQSAAEALVRALPDNYKKVALRLARGMSREEMEAEGFTRRTVDEARARIKQLRKLIPDIHEYRRTLRGGSLPSDAEKQPRHSSIDKEIAELEAMPKHGADCPPCWLCKWFEGYMPGAHVSMRMPIHEAEVRDAVRDTEAEKIRIAQEIRNGDL